MKESAAGPIGTGIFLAMMGFALTWFVRLPFEILNTWWERKYGVLEVGYAEVIFSGWLGLGFTFLALSIAVAIVMNIARWLPRLWWVAAVPAELGGDWELDAPALAPLTARGIADYRHVMTVTLDLNGSTGGNDATTSFTEQTPVSLFSSATISANGVDNNSVDKITLTIAGATATESLSLNTAAQNAANSAGVTVSYSNGVLTLQGSNETNANWQTILRGIKYPTRVITRPARAR